MIYKEAGKKCFIKRHSVNNYSIYFQSIYLIMLHVNMARIRILNEFGKSKTVLPEVDLFLHNYDVLLNK